MKHRIAFTFLLLATTFSFSHAQDIAHIKLDSLNSNYDEYGPVLSPNGQTLYFTVAGHPVNVGGVIDQGDIWFSTKTATGWSSAKHGGEEINHPGLNGVVGFSQDGTRMYTLNYFDPDGRGGGNLKNGISVSQCANGEWQRPEQLSIAYFNNVSSHLSATISQSENVLVLAMESFQTEGNEDLYVSLKEPSGEWSQPQNLGPVINTDSEEWTPFLLDDETLYFASNGHQGEGSRDIFMSKRLDDTWQNWSEPVNLGTELNTKGAERSLFVPSEGNLTYFSTTQNSEGFGDIAAWQSSLVSEKEEIVEPEPSVLEVDKEPEEIEVSKEEAEVLVEKEESVTEVEEEKEERKTEKKEATLVEEKKQEEIVVEKKPEKVNPPEVVPEPVFIPTTANVTFRILDKRTQAPLEASMTLNWADKEVGFNTSSENSLVLSFDKGTKIRALVEAEGFLNYTEEFSIVINEQSEVEDSVAILDRDFLLTPEDVGTVTQIENVLFNRASASFANAAMAEAEIDKLIQLMKANPGMAIRLEGHTDNRGNAKLLKELSEERVQTVRNYMISKGINASRIEAVGMGGENPLLTDDSAEAREKNRRVEFVIIR